ncbi:hypothetical protein EMIHUDRAFT_450204 [Emiliania huxleyi CCMP1516]|uniref:Glutamine amidotransferase type-2 domain-containing protein n=2 Tax=Emiliania huxleyi TaxID=2903 RepID=A0A0D3JUM5_EMIH1|nr:hypothetical protein EMIHUDRAFT_450204 [Emiliania huxleyi CCMP1516]EOD27210.1 hypothetical protein EMIHUDRAFT_450204 [Emiliania huxleyi CCMP1516]|eukprot:XP_005779639.1 hypothetical protein EMIHUDRAFT_450204 [Emiliania huxleyi CCMP1516]
MCRWLVYCGSDPILMSDLIFAPTNSLIHQSFNGGFHPGLSDQNNMQDGAPRETLLRNSHLILNADGFGVGWYHKRGGAIFRSVTAAWNNSNLRELSESIESRCIFAHVRRLLFQHNGHVEGFDRIKRRVFAAMRDDVYHWVQGTTDSEACFALILSLIEPELLAGGECVPVAVLRKAMLSAIATLRGFLADAGVVVVARYCDKAPDIPPPSLYYAFASSHQLQLQLSQALTSSRDDAQEHTFRNQARLSRLNRLCAEGGEAPQNPGHGSTFGCTCPKCRKLEQTVEGGAFICASEPLTTNTSEWFLMKENSMISFTAGTPSADDESEAEECSRLKAMRLDQATPCQRAAFSKAVSTKAARNPTVTTSPAVPAQSPKRRSSWEAPRSFVDEQGARPGPEAEAEARAREDPKSNLDVVSLD